MTKYYAPRTGEQKLNAQKFMEEWEKIKKATHCPPPHEARRILGLSLKQFAELLEVSDRQVSKLTAETIKFTFAQKLLINMAIRLYEKNKRMSKEMKCIGCAFCKYFYKEGKDLPDYCYWKSKKLKKK